MLGTWPAPAPQDQARSIGALRVGHGGLRLQKPAWSELQSPKQRLWAQVRGSTSSRAHKETETRRLRRVAEQARTEARLPSGYPRGQGDVLGRPQNHLLQGPLECFPSAIPIAPLKKQQMEADLMGVQVLWILPDSPNPTGSPNLGTTPLPWGPGGLPRLLAIFYTTHGVCPFPAPHWGSWVCTALLSGATQNWDQ